MTNRNKNYDLLRVISCIAVIVCHVNYLYFDKIAYTPSFSFYYIVESLLNIFTRFCVPCFVMLSGAFLLSNNLNDNFSYFYKKKFKDIVLPTIIIGGVIFIYSVIKTRNIMEYINQIKEGTFYNYWYIYMTIGLYLLTPFIIRIKNSITTKQYLITTLVLLVWAIISQATTTYRFPYSIGVVFAFVGYFMMGNVIYENYHKVNIKTKNCLYVTLVCFGLTFIWRLMGHNNIKFVADAYSNFFSPLVMIASIYLFIYVSRLNVTKGYSKLSKLTLYVYLFHTIIYQGVFKLVEANIIAGEILKIIIIIVVTAIISFVLAFIFDKAYTLYFKIRNSKD